MLLPLRTAQAERQLADAERASHDHQIRIAARRELERDGDVVAATTRPRQDAMVTLGRVTADVTLRRLDVSADTDLDRVFRDLSA
jgi:hypothetical protein